MGAKIAEFLDRVVEITKLRTSDIHFIGHSLGAHVAGSSGYNLKSGKIGRITGKHNGRTVHADNDYANLTFVYIL